MTLTTETRPDTRPALSPQALDLEVLDLVAAAGGTVRGTTIARRSHHNLVDVFVALARLCNNGKIQRTAPGEYRAAATAAG